MKIKFFWPSKTLRNQCFMNEYSLIQAREQRKNEKVEFS